MKPSERIQRIYSDKINENRKYKLCSEESMCIQSIVDYLDEEAEKEVYCKCDICNFR